MRFIGTQEIEDIAVGAALLGTGGGGDPYIGKLMAQQAINDNGPVELVTTDEINEEDVFVPTSMMGAPTVLVEKPPSGEESIRTFKELEKRLGTNIAATFPIEAGGINSMLPFVLAARLGLPVVDVDGMGRAFPEIQMTTFYLDGISATPMAIADEKGNLSLFETINNRWTERLSRSATVEMGGSTIVASYSMVGKQLKKSGVKNILHLEEKIGEVIRKTKHNTIDELLELTKGFQLFSGKIIDIERETRKGFTRGNVIIEGLLQNRGKDMKIQFQNEYLIAETNSNVLCVTPDLIAVLDSETGEPITTEGLKYGARCIVIGIPCDDKWRTDIGIQTCGPTYFGYDIKYQEVEKLNSNN